MLGIIVSNYCMAKDIIVTKNAEKIDANIVEVSKSELKYKKASEPKGPTFVISTNEISTIVFENGDVHTFKKEAGATPADSITIQNIMPGRLNYSKIYLPNGKKGYRYYNDDKTIILTKNEYNGYYTAKDVIVTKNAEIIKSKILEVSNTEIKYKKATDINGPSFTINTGEISTIVYENGNVQTFKDENEVSKSITSPSSSMTQSNITNINPASSANSTNASNSTIQTSTTNINIITEKQDFTERPIIYYSKVTLPNGKRRRRYHNKGNTIILKGKEFKKIVYAECPQAKKHWRRARVWASIAIPMDFVFFPLGVGFTLISLGHSHQILPTYNEQCASGE